MSRCEKVEEKFKSVDWFGQTIQLTYKGNEKYKTNLGAIVSYLLIILLSSYILFRAYLLFNRLYPEVYRNTQVHNFEELGIIKPEHYDFSFSFGLREYLDPSVGYFTVHNVREEITGYLDNGFPIRESKILKDYEMEECGTELFKFDEHEAKTFGIHKQLCITESDYDLYGARNTEQFTYIELKLFKCTNSTSSSVVCKNQTYIDTFFERQVFNFMFTNAVFDREDFEEYYEKFIDDTIAFDLEADRVKKAEIYIQKSELELQDDLIQFGQRKHVHFLQVNNVQYSNDKYSSTEGYLTSITIRLDRKYEVFERKVYQILELLENLGGLQEALFHIGVIFCGFFCQRLFHIHIMKQLYQTRKHVMNDSDDQNDVLAKSNLESRKGSQENGGDDIEEGQNEQQDEPSPIKFGQARQHAKSVHQLRTPSVDFQEDTNSLNGPGTNGKHRNVQFQEMSPDGENSGKKESHRPLRGKARMSRTYIEEIATKLDLAKEIKEKDNKLSKHFKGRQIVDQEDVNLMLMAFLQRTQFSYNMKMVFEYLFKCLCFRNLNKQRHDPKNKKHYMFVKAQHKLEEELDVISVIKTLKKFRLLSQALLSQKHRMLLRFQRQNLVETSTSSSDSDHNNFDALSLMESESPLIKLLIFAKLKKMMHDFEGTKLKVLDRNLIRGIFQRKNKDFQEMLNELNRDCTLLERLTGGVLEKLENKREEYRNQWGEAKDENYQTPNSKSIPLGGGLKPPKNNNFTKQHKKVSGKHLTVDKSRGGSKNRIMQNQMNDEVDISFQSKQPSELDQSEISRPEHEGNPQPYQILTPQKVSFKLPPIHVNNSKDMLRKPEPTEENLD